MLAVEISSPGDPQVLRLVHRPIPQFGPGEVLIRVHASGINRPDVLQRRGHYPAPPGVSDIPGLEVAGVIDSGDRAAMTLLGLHVGQRVCALLSGGGYAQFCVAPAAQCLVIPNGLNEVGAASLPETFFTVWSNLFEQGKLQSGETLLVQGGASGIGVAAIQIASVLGAHVIATAGSEEKCAACLALGAEHVVPYKTHDFVKVVNDVTGDSGADVILDMVAGPYVARELNCLAIGGRLLIIATQGGAKAEINTSLILRRRLTISGSTLRSRSNLYKASIADSLRTTIWPLLEKSRIKPIIHRVFQASEAALAHSLMESNQHIGKLVLAWH